MGVVPMTKTEIQTMYEVMFTDYPDIVNVAQVQSMLNISRHLAYSLINDGYIPGIKIGNAKQYLETTDYSIKKIAQITGFATPSHFCERFTQVVGETPQQYRRNAQKPDFSDMHYTPVIQDPPSGSNA